MKKLTRGIIELAQRDSRIRCKYKNYDKALEFDYEAFEGGINDFTDELGVSADDMAESTSELLLSQNEFLQSVALSLLKCFELDVQKYREALVTVLKRETPDSPLLGRIVRACSNAGVSEACDVFIAKYNEVKEGDIQLISSKHGRDATSEDRISDLATLAENAYLLDPRRASPLCVDIIKMDMSIEMAGFYSVTACTLSFIVDQNEQCVESLQPLLRELEREPILVRQYVMDEFSKGIERIFWSTDDSVPTDKRLYMEGFIRKQLDPREEAE